MSKDWKNSIRNSFEDYQVSEPDGLWDAVEKGLALDSRPVITTPLFWISSITAVAASLLAILYVDRSRTELPDEVYAELSVNDNDRENVSSEDSQLVAMADVPAAEDMPVVAENQAAEDMLAKSGVLAKSQTSLNIDAKEEDVANSSFETSFTPATGLDSSTDVTEAATTETETTAGAKATAEIEATAETETATAKSETTGNSEKDGYMDMQEYLRLTADEEERGFSGKFSLIASASNALEDSRSHGDYGGFYGSDIANSISGNQFDSKPFMSYSRVLYENLDEEVVTEYDHSQPIRFSLEAEYRLNKRFGIVSGLSYSRLSSKVKSGSDITNYSTVQKLDYLGIPLSMNLYFFQNKWAEIYMNAGGMLEKCIAGKSITTYNFNSSDTHIGDKERISEKELQWSADASLGAHLRLYNNLKFFVEPGVSYHFNNSSLVQNIYKERPCNFRFSMGLRYEIRK